MDGADTLNLGPERFTAEEREFDGGPGNDKIDDADSGDVVEGGEGDDEIDVSGDPAIGLRGAPRDIADCGPGTDAIAADTVDQVSNCENTSGTGGGGTGGGGGAGGGGTASQPQADGDGDGVPDSSDACPSTSGPAANAGCPVNAFSVAGKPQYKAGFTILKVSLPGSGVLKGTQTNVNKKHPALLKPALAKATQPGIVKLTFRPTAAGKRVLAKNGKLSVKTKLAYTPTGGKTASTVKRVAVYRRRFHG
jgi:hypothetical protein